MANDPRTSAYFRVAFILLLPASIEQQAAVQRWMYFQAGHVTPACMPSFRSISTRVQAFWKVQGDTQAEQAARKELGRYLPVLEVALTGRHWLEGDFSLADIAYAPHFWLLDEAGFDFAPHAAMRAWLNRLFARKAWQKTVNLIFT